MRRHIYSLLCQETLAAKYAHIAHLVQFKSPIKKSTEERRRRGRKVYWYRTGERNKETLNTERGGGSRQRGSKSFVERVVYARERRESLEKESLASERESLEREKSLETRERKREP